MLKGVVRSLGGIALCASIGGLAQAQGGPTAVAPPPPGAMAPVSKDPTTASAGTYHIDLEHAAAVARVSHRGMSFSVLRFGVRDGVLQWNPAKPAEIALEVTVDAKPFYAPIVYKILPEGPAILNTAKYPDARFVSTAVRVQDKTHATVEGRLTLMGVTKPVTINAQFVGAGRSMEGNQVVGFTGNMIVNWGDFADQPMARMIGDVTVLLDAEFIKN